MCPAEPTQLGRVPVEGPDTGTVTLIPAEVVRLPAASRATAVKMWGPLASNVGFQTML